MLIKAGVIVLLLMGGIVVIGVIISKLGSGNKNAPADVQQEHRDLVDDKTDSSTNITIEAEPIKEPTITPPDSSTNAKGLHDIGPAPKDYNLKDKS